jgi:hypothetical protein
MLFMILHALRFLLLLCFRKVTQEIFSELNETKPEDPIFPRHETESKEESEEGKGQQHHLVAWVPLGVPPYGVGALATL